MTDQPGAGLIHTDTHTHRHACSISYNTYKPIWVHDVLALLVTRMPTLHMILNRMVPTGAECFSLFDVSGKKGSISLGR